MFEKVQITCLELHRKLCHVSKLLLHITLKKWFLPLCVHCYVKQFVNLLIFSFKTKPFLQGSYCHSK